MRRSIIAILLSACLTGCAGEKLIDLDQPPLPTVESARQVLAECSLAVHNSPEFDPIRRKMPVADPTFAQLMDTGVATDAEITSIVWEHERMRTCRKAYLEQLSQATPTVVPIIAAAMAENENILIELIQKKQSWGEYVRRVKKVMADTEIKLVAERRDIQRDQQRSYEVELAERREAADLIARIGQTTITTCSGFGSTVSCVSH